MKRFLMSDHKTPAWQILWMLVFALFALTACQSQPAKQQVAYNGSGFGGTGKQLPHPTGGFGGTGKSSSGFGGTGIVGTITEFGSIWVNGIEIEYGAKTRIESRLTQQETLKLGQQVVLETLPTDTQTLTRKIEVFYPIAGKISQVGEGYIEVNQSRIRMTGQTRLDDGLSLKVGQYVAINGYQAGVHEWVATRVNLNPEQQSFYQPVPKLAFSKGVKRMIVEAGLMQFSGWSFGQEALKRSGKMDHNEKRIVVDIRKQDHQVDRIEMVKPYHQYLQWQQQRLMQQLKELKDASDSMAQQRETQEMIQHQKDMMEMRDILQQQKDQVQEMNDMRQNSPRGRH